MPWARLGTGGILYFWQSWPTYSIVTQHITGPLRLKFPLKKKIDEITYIYQRRRAKECGMMNDRDFVYSDTSLRPFAVYLKVYLKSWLNLLIPCFFLQWFINFNAGRYVDDSGELRSVGHMTKGRHSGKFRYEAINERPMTWGRLNALVHINN